MVTEQTQFSMAEFRAYREKNTPPVGKREEAMNAFAAVTVDFAALGGIDNVQRVRVLADPKAPDARRFEFITKLPPEMAVRKARDLEKAASLAAFKALLALDPKAAEEYLRKVAYKLLDRMVLLALLETCKPPKPVRKAAPKPQRKPALRKPQAQDAFAKALEQDRRNRIEAAKLAAKQFHTGSKKAS